MKLTLLYLLMFSIALLAHYGARQPVETDIAPA